VLKAACDGGGQLRTIGATALLHGVAQVGPDGPEAHTKVGRYFGVTKSLCDKLNNLLLARG
jgi:hypothetical protein